MQEQWDEFVRDTKEVAANLVASVPIDVLSNIPECVDQGKVLRQVLDGGWREDHNDLNEDKQPKNKHCEGSLQQLLDHTEPLNDAEFTGKGFFLCDKILNCDGRSELALPGEDPVHPNWSPVALSRMSFITWDDDHPAQGEEKEYGAGGDGDNNQHYRKLGCNYFR
jgi:hypothetical protein